MTKLPPAVQDFLSKVGTKGGKNGRGIPKNRQVSEYMAALGAKGGQAATGAKKTRPASHYKRLVEIRRKNRLARGRQ